METESGDSVKSINCNANDENFALHKLNDHCLLKIFQLLSFKDAKNVSNTSKRLMNLYRFKYHRFTFEFHSDMLSKTTRSGSKVLDVILSEYGEHIRSWSLIMLNRHKHDAIELVQRVSEYCTNLKRLELRGITDWDLLNSPAMVKCLPTVESLVFFYCLPITSGDFLQHFRSIKHLRFEGSDPTSNEHLQILFRNNREFQSYNYNGEDSFLRDDFGKETFTINFCRCDFGPEFRELCLSNDETKRGWNSSRPISYDISDNLSSTNLTKLKLDLPMGPWGNVDYFLIALAEHALVLKELELLQVTIGRRGLHTFTKSFKSLELLVLNPEWDPKVDEMALAMSKPWPMHLRKFEANIAFNDITVSLIINKLKYLTELNIKNSTVDPKRVIQIVREAVRRKHCQPSLRLVVGNNGFNAQHIGTRRGHTLHASIHPIRINFSHTTDAPRRLTKSFDY